MKDNIWTAIYILLGCVIVVMLLLIMLSTSKTHKVDCSNLAEIDGGVTYKPLPKQCEKGE